MKQFNINNRKVIKPCDHCVSNTRKKKVLIYFFFSFFRESGRFYFSRNMNVFIIIFTAHSLNRMFRRIKLTMRDNAEHPQWTREGEWGRERDRDGKNILRSIDLINICGSSSLNEIIINCEILLSLRSNFSLSRSVLFVDGPLKVTRNHFTNMYGKFSNVLSSKGQNRISIREWRKKIKWMKILRFFFFVLIFSSFNRFFLLY